MIVVKYYNHRMLFTLDLSALVRVLLLEAGSPLDIRFEEMSESERANSTDLVGGIEAVRERFRVLAVGDGEPLRRLDLEKTIVDKGQK